MTEIITTENNTNRSSNNLESLGLSSLKDYEKVWINLNFLVEEQKLTKQDIRLGFIGLAKQNSELLKFNKELNQQLEEIKSELNAVKQEQDSKAARRKARLNRKRLPKRSPITSDIYSLLIKESIDPTYKATRTRIAICLMAVTGVRICELLSLKVIQLETLIKEGWIGVDRVKKGPANHKAFLTKEGKKLVKEREKDFNFLFLMKNPNSYIFTSEKNPDMPIRRETLTMDINKIMHSVSRIYPSNPNITSHSFRVGFITKLWKDTSDIEFVRQSIGHLKIETTSKYIQELSDEERKLRINLIN